MNWYAKSQEKKDYHEFYHGTDSPPFETFDPSKASKEEKFYNPLGEAMYVTDKPEFASMFGKNVYPVRIPKNAKIKRMNPTLVATTIESILKKALKMIGIDYWQTNLKFKAELNKEIEKSQYNPYEAIIEAVEYVIVTFPEKKEQYRKAVSQIATQKFSNYDVVIFVGTNNPNDIFVGSTPTKEILIFNKNFQRIFQETNI